MVYALILWKKPPTSKIHGKILEDLENTEEFKKLPSEIKKNVVNCVNSIPEPKMEFPIITMKENDWIIVITPILNLCSQGRAEDEAIEYLKCMQMIT